MKCKHKNKVRLYKRLKTNWESTEYWVCQDCNKLLKLGEVNETKRI